ncbi:LysR family transcriptional regulator [Pseudomonas lalucatii]|uniref:LysR family transcriptional regulator n=1 Tax=Pseudomonas lalucatii TaxID=1424203 RepID=A0ABS5Q621_9PSED|nr:LysR family transcriptional regulator [Pseudomonas lalucatii]MBS7664238.1 LysR family transcriptional regulator [Pseudomonas lalucatii]MBS7690942.1 LysR family transcriptional regulator [Pseudomonas lalucatii]QVM86551.1 LysR family transcriptional regulator [Pseudomonas lalucatii]
MLSQVRDLDLQLLRLFLTVVESGGFSAAQGELGIGQSTISTQMAKLETRLGFRLCERGKAGFRLTPKGEQVLLAARKLFAAVETFRGEAQGMADKLLGSLGIGLSEALDDEVLARVGAAIGAFRRRNQDVQIELLSAMPAELERRLLQDQLHLAIGYFSGVQNALDYRPLFEEPQALFCGRDHPLFEQAGFGAESLQEQDGVHHPYRFIGADEPWQAAASSARSEQVEGTLAFVLSGAHIGYLPRHIAAPWEARGRLRALLPEVLGFSVQFHLASHRGRQPSEAQRAFVDDLLGAFDPRV